MKYSYDGYNYWMRIDKGEGLTESLQRFINETSIKGAWASGIGAATEIEIGYYNLRTHQYEWQTFKEDREILSLQGMLTQNASGEMIHHLHGTFADERFKVIGGHVRDLMVGGTLELFVHSSFQPLKRSKDENVGLQTLDL